PGGPGDLANEWKRVLQLSTLGVEHVEKAVAIRLGAKMLAIRVEHDELVDAIEVPAVVRGGLEMPYDFAGIDVDGNGRARIQIVALAQVAVPWARIARPEINEASARIVGAAEPRCRAAGLPCLTGPCRVRREIGRAHV